ncbi:hypothetical protein L207DRAFT_290506 [Hyaloscypha variabilis F]|uniref:Uncharacterized protein n=1 Tax=Hyaloscypha variabilis (strain UAMH 11265 / GT02V1 / F) TaxID=1149755 RepID=A0A2J6RX72_HYAVF|nr:hypothetical protein L207DRAFT_290506 [Hyaloscypha variabilis F]
MRHAEVNNFVSLVYFHYQDPLTGFRPARSIERWHGTDSSIKEIGDIIASSSGQCLPGIDLSEAPSQEKSTAMWRGCCHNPKAAVEHRALNQDALREAAYFPGSLIFNTTVATLHTGDPCSYEFNGLIPLSPLGNVPLGVDGGETSSLSEPPSGLEILDSQGGVVGFLNTRNLDWMGMQDRRGPFEFIVISGSLEAAGYRFTMFRTMYENEGFDDDAALRMLNRNERNDTDTVRDEADKRVWRLQVLLVERIPGMTHVVRRVEIGFVWMYMWNACAPRWETIVLY